MAKKPKPDHLIDLLPPHGVLRKFEDREAWLAARKGVIGGSKAPALFELPEAYDSLYTLWAKESGLPEAPDDDNGRKRRGRRLEGPILDELADQTGWQVEGWPQHWRIDHPDPALGAGVTPDGLAIPGENDYGLPPGELIGVQVKSYDEYAYKNWPRVEGELGMPAPMMVQTQLELDCLGLDRGVLVVLFGMDMDWLEIIPYERHPRFIETLHARLLWFWELVRNGEAPEVDGSESTYETLRRTFGHEDGSAVELPGEADIWAAELGIAKRAKAAAEKAEALYKNKLIACIGEATYARTPEGQAFTYKEQTRSGIKAEKLQQDFPEAYAACYGETSRFRVLRAVSKLPAEVAAELLS